MGSDQRIVEFARVSYNSPSKGPEQDQKLLNFLYKNRHTSPFESVQITFDLKMPILVARQYIRHRTQSVNEISARYTELPEEFYIPETWRKQDVKNKQGSVESLELDHKALSETLRFNCAQQYELYQELIRKGVAREMARMVLPVNIYTQMYVSWNLKNLLHFINLRDDAHAQAEIQVYGKAIKAICTKLFPWTMEAYAKYKWELAES